MKLQRVINHLEWQADVAKRQSRDLLQLKSTTPEEKADRELRSRLAAGIEAEFREAIEVLKERGAQG